MCVVDLQIFYWSCGHLQHITEGTNERQHRELRYEKRIDLGFCGYCQNPPTFQTTYKVLPCPMYTFKNFISKTPTVDVDTTHLIKCPKAVDFDETAEISQEEQEKASKELGLDTLTLDEKRKLWYDGYKIWQEDILFMLECRYGERAVKQSYPGILSWEEFKQDIEENDGRKLSKWDHHMAEGAICPGTDFVL